MRLIDEVNVVLFARLLVLLQNTLLYKGYYFDVFMPGVLTGLCLYIPLSAIYSVPFSGLFKFTTLWNIFAPKYTNFYHCFIFLYNHLLFMIITKANPFHIANVNVNDKKGHQGDITRNIGIWRNQDRLRLVSRLL